eukprot:GFUD01089209.1.p1 GENE.GFUD01089209.1~~GFUD01089209.1.p1  ORF type:complete len:607 (+),score=119.83 GFUD01089209.1:142-1962(+)
MSGPHGRGDVKSFNRNNAVIEREGCQSPHTRNCFLATSVMGCLVIVLGLLVLTMAPSFLSSMILKSLALSPGSDRLASWLLPPVEAHLTAYAFNLTNPDEVLKGGKPVVQEVGPFVYRAVTVKDSVDSETGKSQMNYDSLGSTITYRPRKIYHLVSGDPDSTFITVPNIPLLTGFSGIRDSMGMTKGIAKNVMLNNGRGTPFVNVSFTGLLWGYNDELPCFKHTRPEECPPPDGEIDIFSEDDNDDDDWGDEDWKRRKRSTENEALIRSRRSSDEDLSRIKRSSLDLDLRRLNFSILEKPKAELVNCRCQWGLFRDKNVTIRKPVTINHGMKDLSMKGWVEQFDSSTTLGWWEDGSTCDQVGGQDGATLPPSVSQYQEMVMFISLMCRKINLKFEKITTHSELSTYRFIPPVNALGSHTDPDPTKVNLANSCYCRQSKGFSCLKSGVLNLEPCKVTPDLPRGAPIALSFPHFYQADPSFREAVEGLRPNKTLHQFYVDIEPTLGFPLAIRPRFQLNAIIRKDPDIAVMSNFPDELVLPFLWAQDGFSEPSSDMASAIRFGLAAPHRLPLLGGVVLLVLGVTMLLVSAGWWAYWARRRTIEEEIPLN